MFFISFGLDDCVPASRDELHIRKMKLNYQEVGQCSKEAQALWERKLTAPGRMTVPQDTEEMYRALCQGERYVCVCLCVNFYVKERERESICKEVHLFIWHSSYRVLHMWSFEWPYVISIVVCRCSQKQAWGDLVAAFPSAPAASQTAPASASPRHPLSRPAQAAHCTAACYSGGSRWAHKWKRGPCLQ